jgi:dihydroorotate dehydrogenase electron transfer subunit
MAGNIYIGEVAANEAVGENFFLMKVKVATRFETPKPGQFVMMRIAGLNDPFLSRPLSIYAFSRRISHCSLEFLYQVVGKGTQILAGLIEGSQVEINGPLGNGFELSAVRKNVILIAGGIGIAPVSHLLEGLSRRKSVSSVTLYFGAKGKTAILGLNKAKKLCDDVCVCTDDGTAGKKGLVTQLFQKDLKKFKSEDTSIFACGPKAMLHALSKILHKSKFDCQVSLEEKMACGTGACMGCAVAVSDENGVPAYKRVCADGPVFRLSDILWG